MGAEAIVRWEADDSPGGEQLARVDPWAARGRKIHASLFGKYPRAFALAALAVSALMPSHGIGFSLCVFDRVTGLPCPGCGLTRSIASITHLEPKLAWGYHPFGFVVYALLVVLAVSNFVGEPARRRVARWFESHGKGAHVTTWALVLAFLAFGVARACLVWGDATVWPVHV